MMAARPARWRLATWGAGRGLLYFLPALALLAAFTYWPLLRTLWLSFHDWNLISPNVTYVGLKNFSQALTASRFWRVVLTTVLYLVAVLPLAAAFPLAVAVGLERVTLRLRRLLQTLMFMPSLVAAAITSLTWLWIYHPIFGVFNRFLSGLGLPGQPWLSDPRGALWAVAVFISWKSFGYNLVIFAAGLAGISREYFEAARVDGAGGWQIFWRITFPLLSPTLLFVVLTTIVETADYAFTPIHIMTGGGPNGASSNLVFYLYEYGFRFFNVGYASAVAVMMFLGFLAFSVVQMRLSSRYTHYET